MIHPQAIPKASTKVYENKPKQVTTKTAVVDANIYPPMRIRSFLLRDYWSIAKSRYPPSTVYRLKLQFSNNSSSCLSEDGWPTPFEGEDSRGYFMTISDFVCLNVDYRSKKQHIASDIYSVQIKEIPNRGSVGQSDMNTHMKNTASQKLQIDPISQEHYRHHQEKLHSSAIKSVVNNKRKEEVKIVKNKKVELNSNPNEHVNILFNNLHKLNQKTSSKSHYNHKPTIDNKEPQTYQFQKTILKDKVKKNKQEKFQASEHEKEWRALQSRIQNCKSYEQRKKDKTDPIANPVYFIKPGSKAGDVNIDPYVKKILSRNRPQSATIRNASSAVDGQQFQMNSTHQMKPAEDYGQPLAAYGSHVPNLSSAAKNQVRPSTATNKVGSYTSYKENNSKAGKGNQAASNGDDLPECTYKGIMNHLLKNKIYKDNDIKVLYVRLCYRYGEDSIDELWQRVMDDLER